MTIILRKETVKKSEFVDESWEKFNDNYNNQLKYLKEIEGKLHAS